MFYMLCMILVVEEKVYGVYFGGVNLFYFVIVVCDVVMDFINDDGVKVFGLFICFKFCWDKCYSKYVVCVNDDDGFKGVKMICGEFGVKIVVFFQFGRFDKWKKFNCIGCLFGIGELEKFGLVRFVNGFGYQEGGIRYKYK